MKNPMIGLYERLPIWAQNLAMSVVGIKLYHERYGKYFREHIKRCRVWNMADETEQKKIQNYEFQKLLEYARNNSPFYRNLYADCNLNKVKTVEDIAFLPVVEKEELRNNISDVYTIGRKKAIIGHTGGTTGKALEFLVSRKDMQQRMAVLACWEEGFGIKVNSRRASFNGRQFVSRNQKKRCYWRYNFIRKQMLYSTFDITAENIPYYIKSLNKFKPEVINGFVSAIYEIAQYINANKIQMDFKPLLITTTSETLLPYHRESIEKAFHCKVRNQYASSEGAPFVAECKCGKLHYYITTGIIEEYPTEYGNEMLVTGFRTYGTPLIRYRIGDMWEVSSQKCSCGSAYPVVEKIEGRKVDFLYASDGRKVSLSHLADVIKGLPNSIINLQFIQEKRDELIIKMVVDKKIYSSSEEAQIRKEIEYRFGSDMDIQFVYVNEIEREKSGKYALIKNRLEGK